MAALDLISEVANDGPLLLVVDDAHWLDRPTADVLAFVARRIESDPVLLLAAARDGYPAALADAGLPEHRLTVLDDATAAALLDAAAPDLPLDDAEPCAALRPPATPWRCSSCRRRPVERGRASRLRRPAADRAPRARVRRSRLRSARRHAAGRCWSRRSATTTPSTRSSRAASAVAGTPLDARGAGAGRRGGAHRRRRRLHPFPPSADSLRGLRRAPACKQRRRVHEALAATLDGRSRPPRVAPRRAGERDPRGACP